MTNQTTTIEFTRVNNDVNGNPRYVCHFTHLLSDAENRNYEGLINNKYAIAIKRANKIGGKKFHNKQYGGGIVFQSYNIKDTEKRIFELLETGK